MSEDTMAGHLDAECKRWMKKAMDAKLVVDEIKNVIDAVYPFTTKTAVGDAFIALGKVRGLIYLYEQLKEVDVRETD